MPKCTINNIPVEVPEGTSIISTFQMLNKDIASYCWHPGLSHCRCVPTLYGGN